MPKLRLSIPSAQTSTLGGQDESYRTVCDRRANSLGIRTGRTVFRSFRLGDFDRMARHWICTSTQLHLHRAGNYVVLLCQHLLALDVALQSRCYMVAFFVDNDWNRSVLAGALSSSQLTNGGMGGGARRSSSDSPDPGNFYLELHPSNRQDATNAQLT